MSGSVPPVTLDSLTPMQSFPDGSHLVISQPSPVDPTKRIFGIATLDAAGIPTSGTASVVAISQIPDASGLAVTNVMPIYQDGTWKQTTLGDILSFQAVSITAPAPGTTTPAPGTTTPAPGTTTPAPGTTTPAPGTTAPWSNTFLDTTVAATLAGLSFYWLNKGNTIVSGGGGSPLVITAPNDGIDSVHGLVTPLTITTGSIIARITPSLSAASGGGLVLVNSGSMPISTLFQTGSQYFLGVDFSAPQGSGAGIDGAHAGNQAFGVNGTEYLVKLVRDANNWTYLAATTANAALGVWTLISQVPVATVGPVSHVGLFVDPKAAVGSGSSAMSMALLETNTSVQLQAAYGSMPSAGTTPSPTPTPLPVNGMISDPLSAVNTLFGANVDGYTGTVQAYDAWLGQPSPLSSIFTGNASQNDYTNSIYYAIGIRGGDEGRQCISTPNFWSGANFTDAANGVYDAIWRDAIERILTKSDADPNVGKIDVICDRAGKPRPTRILWRIDWEHNAFGQFPWASGNVEANFIAAWRRFVGIIRSVDTLNRVKIVFCPEAGNDDPALSYPGDDVVDFIGLDVYNDTVYGTPFTPVFAWDYHSVRSTGVNWLIGFGKQHGKPICFPEWGVSTENFGPYLKRFRQMCIDNNVSYACYWESNGAYSGKLSDNSNNIPNTSAAYGHYFGSINKFPSYPAPPIHNYLDYAQDLSGGAWYTYTDTGSINRAPNSIAFVGNGGSNQSVQCGFVGEYPHNLGIPAERFVFAATVTRTQGSGPLTVWQYDSPYVDANYTLQQLPLNVPKRIVLKFSIPVHQNELLFGFHNGTGTDNAYTITDIGLFVDMVDDPYPLPVA